MSPPELHIQRFLRDSGASSTEQRLATLRSRYAITAKRHGGYPNLVLLKYSQIDSPFAEPIVRECRGIVLDEADDWRVVALAFTKFFNDGEGHAAPIDWSTALVQEKVDGSLCCVYEYRGIWHVATTGTADASGEVHGAGGTFANYFWDTFEAHGGWALDSDDADICYFFELCGPANRIVVVHEKPHLTLLGARRRSTLEELHPSQIAWHCPGVPVVREFPLQSIDDIVKSFETLSPLKQEGYVVVDAQFNRVKVKSPGYVALHHAKDGLSPKAFLEIARSGEVSEVLAAFPEFEPMMNDAKARLDEVTAVVDADYERLRAIPEQKAFALEAVKTRCSAALFALRAGKCLTARRFFAEMRIDALMKLVGLKDAPSAATEAA